MHALPSVGLENSRSVFWAALTPETNTTAENKSSNATRSSEMGSEGDRRE
jgi:hypothetical protein